MTENLDEWRAEFDRVREASQTFLARYSRGCRTCGSEKHLLAFTPRTFVNVITVKTPAWEMIGSGREDLVIEFLDRIGAEVHCFRCSRRVAANGRWSAIVEARRREELKQMGFILPDLDEEENNG